MKKLNICHLGHKRIPSREGGIEIVVAELATRMAAMGHCVTCYNRWGHHVSGKEFDTAHKKEYMGVRLRDVPTVSFRGMAAMTASVTAAIAASFGKYDIVHFHAEGPSFMCWLPKLFRKRVIVTVHGLDHQRAKWGRFASAYIMMGERNAVRFADEIIVLNKATQKYFLDTYGRETVVIPNGLSPAEKQPADEILKEFGLSTDSYILFLGRIVPEKGIHYLIEAFQGVHTDKKLVIAGGSSDTDQYMSQLQAACKDNDRVIFTGFVQGRLLEELYSNAYVYVLPSDLEGMPLSLLEAMSFGDCCLTSDIPECADVIGDQGVVFRKGDVVDLREKLQMLCDSPETVERYKSGVVDYAVRNFSWDKTTEKTLELYQRK